jgi:hypothetical protein
MQIEARSAPGGAGCTTKAEQCLASKALTKAREPVPPPRGGRDNLHQASQDTPRQKDVKLWGTSVRMFPGIGRDDHRCDPVIHAAAASASGQAMSSR